jgi:hypothetical protein
VGRVVEDRLVPLVIAVIATEGGGWSRGRGRNG